MKHKVKLIGVKDDTVTLRIDGVQYSYLIQRPTPLVFADASLLRNVMDSRLLESMAQVSGLVRPKRNYGTMLLEWFSGVWRHRDRIPFPCEVVANHITKVGVEVNLDKKTKCVIILKSDVDKIREGRL